MQRNLYKLKCLHCQSQYDDDGFLLECKINHEPGLLVSAYATKTFECDTRADGISRYRCWLPTCQPIASQSRTITYQSEGLKHITGLSHIWVAFNGYWPEREVAIETTTFKELEAYSVLSRIPVDNQKVLVVASAGNTAAAFAYTCSKLHRPCLIIIPSSGMSKMQFAHPLDPCVKLVSLTGLVDYYDAIVLANTIAKHDNFFPEGGIKNIARRDGLGTTLLSAIEVTGQLPDYYFQAIGSGAGAIAVHETAKRLILDGRFGKRAPRLILSQNFPFIPIYLSWKAKQREMIDLDRVEGKKQIQQVAAYVLSNQQPPYAIKGGVYDALSESKGDMMYADNQEVFSAMQLFEDTEGIDIDPASGVAFATLMKMVMLNQIDKRAHVLLNITGGGWNRKKQDCHMTPLLPSMEVQEHELGLEKTVDKIMRLFF